MEHAIKCLENTHSFLLKEIAEQVTREEKLRSSLEECHAEQLDLAARAGELQVAISILREQSNGA